MQYNTHNINSFTINLYVKIYSCHKNYLIFSPNLLFSVQYCVMVKFEMYLGFLCKNHDKTRIFTLTQIVEGDCIVNKSNSFFRLVITNYKLIVNN